MEYGLTAIRFDSAKFCRQFPFRLATLWKGGGGFRTVAMAATRVPGMSGLLQVHGASRQTPPCNPSSATASCMPNPDARKAASVRA